MGIQIDTFKTLTGGWTSSARRCDSCKTAAAAAFCRADSAFLCLTCDSKIHGGGGGNKPTRHPRVWMCEVCEQAPAAVTCKADAAALCVTCDSDIHSANPLARRHERVPVEPFFDSADSIVKSSPFNFLVQGENGGFEQNHHDHQDDVGGVSWLLPNPPDVNSKLGIENHQQHHHHHHHHHQEVKGSGDLFFSEMDPFLDFEYQNSLHRDHSGGNDSVVPVQANKPSIPNPLMNNNNHENCFDIDFCRSKLSSFNYPSQSLSQSVSSSSLDVGVVPDGNSMSEISYNFGQNMSGNTDPTGTMSGSTVNQATQLCGIDREARVLRYREKRKNRKFEKTIRYASRKAYAETRPRIKGRFAKRTEIESDMESMYNSASMAFMADNQYGVVPTF